MRFVTRALKWSSVGALLCAAPLATAANLIVNGDFSAGNSGFSSSYTYSPGNCQPPAVYDVTTDPHNCHPLFSSFGDHTTGSGNMMVVNGAQQAGVPVWGETVAVLPNTTYFFSVWVATDYPLSPAELDFSINGAALGPTFTASSTTGQWQQFYQSWFSGSNTTAMLGLVNQNTAFSGNDFALDDIVLDTTRPVPEPATLLLACSALLGVGLTRRKRKTTP